jgi:hypothetical protein
MKNDIPTMPEITRISKMMCIFFICGQFIRHLHRWLCFRKQRSKGRAKLRLCRVMRTEIHPVKEFSQNNKPDSEFKKGFTVVR